MMLKEPSSVNTDIEKRWKYGTGYDDPRISGSPIVEETEYVGWDCYGGARDELLEEKRKGHCSSLQPYLRGVLQQVQSWSERRAAKDTRSAE